MSDGVVFVLLMDCEKVVSDGMKLFVKFCLFVVVGVLLEVMGIGLIVVILKVLKLVGLELFDIGLFELNEVFVF